VHVSVVIVGFRNRGDVVSCLEALAKSDHGDFDVIICENGGATAYEALRAAAPEYLAGGQAVRVLQASENLGYAGGVNFGMAGAPDADVWWVLNPDTEPEPTAMSRLLERLSEGDCDAVGATIYLPDGRIQTCGGRWRPMLARAISLGHGRDLAAPMGRAEVEAAQSYLSGASMMITRRFAQEVGPMREDYFLYCEEVEWFLRAKTRGMRLGFASEARVLHHAGTTTGSYNRKQPKTPVYLDERNKILVTRDCFPQLLPVASVSALLLLILRFGKRLAWRQLAFALQGWAAGLANRRGPPAWIETKLE
jgi:N-acetylglucosaminyl-diphospho-decaprenol L-rhamnosyltransferase